MNEFASFHGDGDRPPAPYWATACRDDSPSRKLFSKLFEDWNGAVGIPQGNCPGQALSVMGSISDGQPVSRRQVMSGWRMHAKIGVGLWLHAKV
jgi:hypothetical protein